MSEWLKLKEASESGWADVDVYSNVSGYQIQPGTKWREGLSKDDLLSLASLFKFQLPQQFSDMLLVMNGVDRPQVEVLDDEDGTEEFGYSIYSYPEHFELSQRLLEDVLKCKAGIEDLLKTEGYSFTSITGFIPIYGHKFLVVTDNLESSPVVSCIGDDYILYERSLLEFWSDIIEKSL